MRATVREFSLPLARPLGTAKGVIEERRGFLVGVAPPDVTGSSSGNDGSTPVRGIGEAAPLPGWTESREDCGAALSAWANSGPDVDAEATLSPLEEAFDAGAAPPDRPAARHAVALARADAAARAADRPLAAWLRARAFGDGALPADDGAAGTDPSADRESGDVAGPPVPDTVPANATVGDGSVEETVADAEAAVGEGFDCLKVKVGARTLDADLARLRAVREVVGDDVTLRADANGAWDRPTAERAVAELADLDVAYVEQPLPADDLAGHDALRGRGVGIAIDEALYGPDGAALDRALSVADVLILKPVALGGALRAVEAAHAALAAGATPVVTTTIDAVVARTAAVHVAAAIPDVRACGLATGDRLARDLAPDPAPTRDGAVRVPAGPGIAGEAFDGLLNGEPGGSF